MGRGSRGSMVSSRMGQTGRGSQNVTHVRSDAVDIGRLKSARSPRHNPSTWPRSSTSLRCHFDLGKSARDSFAFPRVALVIFVDLTRRRWRLPRATIVSA